MAVISVNLVNRQYDKDTGASATDTYRVVVDSVMTGDEVVVATDGTTTIPSRGDSYSALSPRLRVQSIAADLEQPPDYQVWTVTAEYSTAPVVENTDNPLDLRASVSISDSVETVPWYQDINGNALTNSANETFDPPVQKDIHDATITIVRNVLFYDEVTASEYRGRVNSSSFSIRGSSSPIAAFKAKVVSYTGQEQFSDEFTYWTETIVIQTRKDGWKRRLLDHGFSTRDPISGNPLVVKDAEGYPLNEPILLNGSGQRLPVNTPAVFLVKELDEYADFNDLDLPTGF